MQQPDNAPCPLCGGKAKTFARFPERVYYKCGFCAGVFLGKKFHLPPAREKMRYLEHNNDIHDPGYRDFVRPLVSRVLEKFSPGDRGLDFGAGTGPAASRLLEEEGFKTALYDPFFYPDESCLKKKYDYIIACEVIEHFRSPRNEFALLFSLLLPGGELIIKTDIYQEKILFDSWYYKNDPTHVFFYAPETFEWIKNEYKFISLQIDRRIITLSR